MKTLFYGLPVAEAAKVPGAGHSTDLHHQASGREEDFPGDQHWLLALSAPRPLYVASATEDTWADPVGEWLSAREAGAVYVLFGLGGIGECYPAPDTPEVSAAVAYHVRTGAHDITAWDWAQYLAFFGKTKSLITNWLQGF